MTVKLIVGGYYKLSDGRVVGPAAIWDNDMEHPFQIPVASDKFPNDAYTLFRRDGTTEYASFHVVEQAPAPSFVVAGAYYETEDGTTVGPMVGPDVYGRFVSAGNELFALRHDGVPLGSYQQWEDDGRVLAEGPHEKGHRLVRRVESKEAGSADATAPAKQELTLKIDLKKDGFVDAFRLTTDEFVRQLNMAQTEIDKKDAEIEDLKRAYSILTRQRNEWFEACKRTSQMKIRGDNRLRLARSRYKVQRVNAEILQHQVNDLKRQVAELEKGERSKKVKAALDFVGGIAIVGVVAVATWFLAVA